MSSSRRRSTRRRWAKGRQVIVHGEALFWTARPVDPQAPATPQGPRLAPEEVTYWSSLSLAVREALSYDGEENRRRRAVAAGGREVVHQVLRALNNLPSLEC